MGHLQGTPVCKLTVFPHVAWVVSGHCSFLYIYNIVAKEVLAQQITLIQSKTTQDYFNSIG
jgi:hypothetical protein